ncbi:MAG: phosphoglycerate kinase [Nanoarchaeota archaeon]|nr:phosphoglycerate kinase [Nanoarchaeota archaeon]MBU1703924.1 phosphoglycerate kinase [Nanoarchaeota archaeon]
MKTLRDIDVSDKKVIVRVDFNVPLEKAEGGYKVADDTRIVAAMETINFLKDKASKIILMSHLGKPKKEIKKGKSEEEVRKKLTMKHILPKVTEIIAEPVGFMETLKDEMPTERIVLLENLRFDKGEESKDENERQELAKQLAGFADVYVNDAFGTCHRAHASIVDVPKLLSGAAGFLLEKEIKALQPFINPGKGSVAILGGAKIEDKLSAIKSLLSKYDKVLLGGGMIFTFFKAQGYEIGKSLLNNDMVGEAKELASNENLVLPVDIVVSKIKNPDKKLSELGKEDYSPPKMVSPEGIEPMYTGLDIGSETIDNYSEIIAEAKKIFWNGPMGLFELRDFSYGTKAIGEAIADNKGAVKIAGGGDSVLAINQGGYDIPVSTGGGASIELVEKGNLPGIQALENNP